MTSYRVFIPFNEFKFYFCDDTPIDDRHFQQFVYDDNLPGEVGTIELCYTYTRKTHGMRTINWFPADSMSEKVYKIRFTATSAFGSWWEALTEDLENGA